MTNTSGKIEKVTVSREVAEALTVLLQDEIPESIVEGHTYSLFGYNDRFSALNGLPLDTLIRALYLGYEIQLTPEEELAEFIEEHHSKHDPMFRKPSDDYHYGVSRGARKAAEILGVELPKLPGSSEGADAN
ncbi:hypothetical protein AB1K91_17635 [Terribacillus sp. 179-K 1B1 HS]|uniref:hypothetical protein n=1 Tax=Terribacillus sp. 179-K 1B1 HS TaxID=3142388 RepID=UPI00399F76EC